MTLAAEWSTYAISRRGVRVSWNPQYAQRSRGISASDEVATRRTDESLVIRLNTDQEEALRNKPLRALSGWAG
jgi:Pyruvate/2-oxoacid:ferredoxin oxidoreductase gamma subunit